MENVDQAEIVHSLRADELLSTRRHPGYHKSPPFECENLADRVVPAHGDDTICLAHEATWFRNKIQDLQTRVPGRELIEYTPRRIRHVWSGQHDAGQSAWQLGRRKGLRQFGAVLAATHHA